MFNKDIFLKIFIDILVYDGIWCLNFFDLLLYSICFLKADMSNALIWSRWRLNTSGRVCVVDVCILILGCYVWSFKYVWRRDDATSDVIRCFIFTRVTITRTVKMVSPLKFSFTCYQHALYNWQKLDVPWNANDSNWQLTTLGKSCLG